MAENTKVKEPVLWETFGWTEETISPGTVYYYNTKTNEMSWERPQDLHDEDTEKAGDWIQQKAQTELVYYYNPNTKVSTWATPAELRQQRIKQKNQFRRISMTHREFGLQDIYLPVPNEGKHLDLQNINAWKTDLIQALKERYKQQFDAILPIPYIRDKTYCVNNIFVESVVELKTVMWSSLSSYHDVFSDARVIGKERILTGEPGFGKSTLSMQYAYDWYTKAERSSMKDVEILILLRLRQLHGVRSIFEAIRRFLLPQNSTLTENRISFAIRNSLSVVVILDGLDEFPDESNLSTDIVHILITGVFKTLELLVTSRNFPFKFSPETRWLRLTGFDERAREEYIRKAVVGDDEVSAERIKKRLKESPILEDLCKIPLFFAMFAHMTHEDKSTKAFSTVTSFFKCLIQCLYSHMRNKMEDTNVQNSSVFEENYQDLYKVAFENLIGKKIIWKTDELRERIGEYVYNEYVTLGILVEEEVPYNVGEDGKSSFNKSETEVRFYQQHFCSWYGAHYVQHCASRLDEKQLKETLRYLTPLRNQYCYRFACGLNRQRAKVIIKCLKDNENTDKIAELCTIEELGEVDDSLKNGRDLCSREVVLRQDDNKLKELGEVDDSLKNGRDLCSREVVLRQDDNKLKELGEVDDSLKNVRDLCSRGVVLRQDDNKLKVESTIELLETASRHEIPISLVELINCYSGVDLSSKFLQLSSNFRLSVLPTVRNMVIKENGRKISETEWKRFLLYLSNCRSLKSVKFYSCLMPQSLHPKFVSTLRLKTCQVSWYPRGGLGVLYTLCPYSGLWKLFGSSRKMTDKEYQMEVQKFTSRYGKKTEQT